MTAAPDKPDMLLGCPFEGGIEMMLRFGRGITGAAAGPGAVLAALNEPDLPQVMLPLARYHLPTTRATRRDGAAIRRQQALTEAAHAEVTAQAARWQRAGYRTLAIGGDHSLTFPLLRGVAQTQPGRRLGLVYLDAHLDMRPLESFAGVDGLVSSGNSFRRLIEQGVVAGSRVAVIGIHRTDSQIFGEMLAFAKQQGVTIIFDEDCDDPATVVAQALAAAQADADGLYLSVDIDAAAAEAAPGVSAPAGRGVSAEFMRAVVASIASQSRVVGFDVVEVSARERAWFELDGQPFAEPAPVKAEKLEKTAQLAAQVIQALRADI